MVEVRGTDLDGAARLLASARARLAAAAADLALPPALRLTEWQRTTVAALRDSLVGAIDDELRSALAGRLDEEAHEGARAALSSARVEIAAPLLGGGGALADPALVSALLRRAEEHRLHRAAGGEQGLLLSLAGDDDEDIAREAMGLLLGQAGRLDAFQEPLMARAELAAEIEHGLLWSVAAALRAYLVSRHGIDAAAADATIAAAAEALLAGYDEGETFDARALRLVRSLRRQRRLDGGFAARALEGGSLTLGLAALAELAGIGVDAAWQLVGEREGAALLLRAAGLAREEAGAILVALQRGDEAETLDRFDAIDPAAAGAAVALWRADPAYRDAVADLAA